MTIELWQLVAVGHEGGAMARTAKAGECPKCRQPWLYGLDSDIAALDAKVDPEPLSAFGELQALLADLRTYELHRTKEGYRLDWRDATHIRPRAAGSGVVDVLAEHRCGSTLATGPPVLRSCQAIANAEPDF